MQKREKNISLKGVKCILTGTEKFHIMRRGVSVDPIQFCKEFKEEFPDAIIYVGSDSQNHGRFTTYSTAIVLLYPNNKGGRVVYMKKDLPRQSDVFLRLFAEAQLSIEVAAMLESNGINVDQIDLDYASKKQTKSTPAYNACASWIAGMGFEVSSKPSEDETQKFSKKKMTEQPASIAADKLVR